MDEGAKKAMRSRGSGPSNSGTQCALFMLSARHITDLGGFESRAFRKFNIGCFPVEFPKHRRVVFWQHARFGEPFRLAGKPIPQEGVTAMAKRHSSRITNTWKRFRSHIAFVLLVAAGVLGFCGTPLNAQDWMFRRSYFSHAAPDGVDVEYPRPRSRSAYRRPIAGSGFGFAARGAYRYNRIQIRSGDSIDVTVIRDFRFEMVP